MVFCTKCANSADAMPQLNDVDVFLVLTTQILTHNTQHKNYSITHTHIESHQQQSLSALYLSLSIDLCCAFSFITLLYYSSRSIAICSTRMNIQISSDIYTNIYIFGIISRWQTITKMPIRLSSAGFCFDSLLLCAKSCELSVCIYILHITQFSKRLLNEC